MGVSQSRGYLYRPDDVQPYTRTVEELVPYKSKAKKYEGKLKPVKVKTISPLSLPSYVRWIVPAFHPSYVLRQGFKPVTILLRDVDRAWRFAHGEEPLPPTAYSDGRPFRLYSGYTGRPPTIAVDIETYRFPTQDQPEIERVAVSAGRYTTWTAEWSDHTRDILQQNINHAGVVIFHNASFDVPILERNGILFDWEKTQLWDTMLAAQLREPDLPKGLATVASMYLDLRRWKHESQSAPAEYNAKDAYHTVALYEPLGNVLDHSGQRRFFERVVMQAMPVLMRLHEHGVCVNTDVQSGLRRKYEEEISILRAVWEGMHPGINPMSNPQLKSLFYTKMGLKAEKGKDRKISVDETALRKLESRIPAEVALLLDLRSKSKDLSTFINVPLQQHADGTWRTHPHYLPILKDDDADQRGIAGTGRIQAKDPNIMQVPKHIRRMYVPLPGHVFIEFDFDQAELRVAAALSGDHNLYHRLQGPDIHTVHAALWGCDRGSAKTITYGTLYGAGPKKLQMAGADNGIRKTIKEWEALQNKFFEDYPDLVKYREAVLAKINQERKLVNPFGRARYFWNPSSDAPAAFDFGPQSVVADVGWSLIPGLDSTIRAFGGVFTTLVHDSFLFSVPEQQAKDATNELSQLLETRFPNVAPDFYLPASPKCGYSWGELSSALVGSV